MGKRTGGTLESIVNQATTGIPHHHNSPVDRGGDRGDDDFVSWFDDCLPETHTITVIDTMAVDALVPTSSTNTPNYNQQVAPSTHVSGMGMTSKCLVDCSTRVASCCGDAEMARVGIGSSLEEISKDFRITESFGNEEVKNLIKSMVYKGRHSNMADQTVSRGDTIETGERSLGAERVLTTISTGSSENTFKHSKNRYVKLLDSVLNFSVNSHKESKDNEDDDEKKGSKISSFSTKRSRAAASHNQSERKRRDKINQRMKTLQKLVPTSSKPTDKASMLDEVTEYLKQLQAQVKAMSMMIHVNMHPPAMMLPNMAFQQQQQQFQMSIMGMARPIDVNALSSPNITTMPSILHATAPSNFNMPPILSPGADPLASFIAPMTMNAYSRMAALYQEYLQSNTNHVFKK
ncbi:hypothetical protein H5410_050512 [Solanum commersonii]|uniref:BHLH domain-containing protein n=1 Tax=Solanum commersonii TaxID=4109 RepID=A0A9J5WX98_SOLCO|nr:hypothetical protein H5410_050512 [Solanum commersonii]